MAKKEPSEAEVPAVPTQETPLPEEVVVPPEEGAVEPAAQEEKPDLRAQFDALPEEDREAFLAEKAAERIKRAEQSGRDSAYDRLRVDQQRQARANQKLQDTLRNLDTETDDNNRAGHILAFVNTQIQEASQLWAQETLENLRESYGLSPQEHDEIVLRLRQQGIREQRTPTFGDYTKAVTGERYMPKGEVTKQLRAEVEAALEERLGKQREGEPAPVSVGQGAPAPSGSLAKVRDAYGSGEIDTETYVSRMKALGAKP